MRIEFFSAGYCTTWKKWVLPHAKAVPFRFHALFACILHPQHGPVLFDTGYSQRFFEATRTFPLSLYPRLTPVTFSPDDSAALQLEKRGIPRTAVKHIILSHFHPDHIGGLRDFPDARLHCLQTAYRHIQYRRGWRALRAGFLPSLMPEDFQSRVHFLDDQSESALPTGYLPLTSGWDLWGDGLLWCIPLPGHIVGQIGLLVRTQPQEYFLVSDACWASDSFRQNQLPHAIAQRVQGDRRAYAVTLKKLHHLHQSRPTLAIIPTHCEEAWQALVNHV